MGLQQMAQEPDLNDPTYVAYKFKATSGQLRALGQKKLQLKHKEETLRKQVAQVVEAKETLLAKLQTCHQEMEESHSTMPTLFSSPGCWTQQWMLSKTTQTSRQGAQRSRATWRHSKACWQGESPPMMTSNDSSIPLVKILEDAGQKKRNTQALAHTQSPSTPTLTWSKAPGSQGSPAGHPPLPAPCNAQQAQAKELQIYFANITRRSEEAQQHIWALASNSQNLWHSRAPHGAPPMAAL